MVDRRAKPILARLAGYSRGRRPAAAGASGEVVDRAGEGVRFELVRRELAVGASSDLLSLILVGPTPIHPYTLVQAAAPRHNHR
jgi:hypothetical protein